MSKSSRAMVQISVALVLALAAGVVMFRWTSAVKRQHPAGQASARTAPVVVAKADIPLGTKLTAGMLLVRPFTTDSRPPDAFAEVAAVEGRVLNVAVGVNEAVTARKLADKSVMGGGVSALIEPGKRAMAVKGNAVMGLAGFVRPGDRVDVLVSLTVGKEDKPVAKLVLERVKVLATGSELTPNGEGKTAPVDVYTLELTPEESERLALAATRGTLHFALRNEQDAETVLTTGATVPSALAALKPKPKPRPAPRPKVTVEVITGGSSQQMTF
ncbi:Flp pilus assembly protein CpaB [Pseudodesulfovibrio sp.]|uniref:Flp pilus assembly protein CpaB n=1 Tax=Pseudodesulfovibrio sp. TaxID=2035812 RepID=UPI00261D9CD6|nr:Flp pilus assembly protein CpaB [Pseudodesulfovibrio sp.]MDD3311553.1 Flp pilus assembly protein CpaB [Pseudodesulfovibrio sp.]